MRLLRPDEATFRRMYEALNRDPNFRLLVALQGLADSGNPYYAWMAIETCISQKKNFPDWLIAYLAQCAERVLSDKAKKEGCDLRKVLPWVFGFPSSLDPAQSKCESASNIDPSPNRQNHLIRKQFIEISGGHAWTPVAPEEI
jgi:hypothetical protein